MALITCPECSKEISDQAAFCPSCGVPLKKNTPQKFCKHCGESIDADCIICPKCGKQVEDIKVSEAAEDRNIIINNNNSATSSAAASANNGGVAHSGKPVNKIIYCILAFFLGGIGVHKFYAGKIGMGILYVLFSCTGIPALIALIEAIIALCKTADADGNIWV